MRDGSQLAATLWRPAASGRYPIILVRSPYPRACCTIPALAEFYTQNSYAVVSQDVRGRGDSEGTFGFWFQEGNDGYDSIEWLAKQPWSNGRIGMMGPSYPGGAQWFAARAHPPHLICIVPTSTTNDYFRDWPYMGGAFGEWQALSWVNSMIPTPSGTPRSEIDIVAMPKYQPLATADVALAGRVLPLYRDLLAHPSPDAYWKPILFDNEEFASIDLPVLHIAGWYDWAQGSEIYMWHGMTQESPAAGDQYLLLGAWTHDSAFFGGSDKVGVWEMAQRTVLDMKQIHREFFDRYLKGNRGASIPRVRLFVTGADTWRTFLEYPPATARPETLYFHSQGHAASASGDGTLSASPPTAEAPDTYDFDPNPTDGRQAWLADPEVDRAPKETRSDVLIYTGAPLVHAVEIIGRPEVELYAASDAPDTDFVVSLLDLYPDGRVRVLGAFPGVLRMRYRFGANHEVLLTPGVTEQVTIPLADIAHRFLPGHRIRVEITSCAAPLMSINPNTGKPIASNVGWRIARNTVHHTRELPSRIRLPIMAP